MKKYKICGMSVLIIVMSVMLQRLCVRAAEVDYQEEESLFQAGTVWQIVSDTDGKETADKTSDTVHVFMAGTVVLLLEDEQDGWGLVQNQSDIGYVPVEALQIYAEGNLDAMNREFEETEQEHIRVIEEYELIKKEKTSSLLWKIVIVGFVVIIFGMGVYDAFKRNEKDDSRSV